MMLVPCCLAHQVLAHMRASAASLTCLLRCFGLASGARSCKTRALHTHAQLERRQARADQGGKEGGRGGGGQGSSRVVAKMLATRKLGQAACKRGFSLTSSMQDKQHAREAFL
jgi:hypothetical protein